MAKRTTTRGKRPTRNASALSDHAKVRGVRKGRANKRKGERKRTFKEAARRAFAVGGSVLGLAGLGYGVVELSRWAEASPRFAIDEIEVHGAARAQEATLRRMLGVAEGDNLVAADADLMQEQLLVHPWVAQVDVDKRYPRGLVVTVEEYEPVALVALDNLYYADASAEIVKRYSPGEQVDLPVITGLTREEIESGDSDAQARLELALGFLAQWRSHHGEHAPEISEINVDPIMGLSFISTEDEARIELGAPPYEAKIARWSKVKATLTARGVIASRVTLSGSRHPERVVARLGGRSGMAAKQDRAALAPSGPSAAVASAPEGAR